MAIFESKREQLKPMPCASINQPVEELKKDGWEYEWSFHTRFTEQWNQACDKVESLQKDGFWEVVLVQGQDELEKKDGVAYLYKKKIEK